MAKPQTEPGALPPTIDIVPPSQRIVQCFGWIYGYLGVLAIATSIGLAYVGAWTEFREETQALGLLAGLALAGPILLWWEFHRRAARTVLVPRGGAIGIYRRGRFDRTIRIEDMMIHQRSRAQTLRAAIGLPLCAMIFLILPLYDRDYWPWAVVGIVLLIGLISGARTFLRLERCVIPGARYPQELLLEKSDLRRLLGGALS